MNKCFFIVSILSCIFFSNLTAQDESGENEILNDGYVKEQISNKKPIPYAYVNESDVMWSKKIWRVIDLREKMNQSLYYPIAAMDERFSLIQLLLNGVQYDGLTAYSTKYNDEFKVPMTWEQVRAEMGAVTDTLPVEQADGTFVNQIISGDVRVEEVKQIMVKEIWFFDKKYSRLDVRILGICPIREYERDGFTDANGQPQIVKKAVAWFYFPECRDILASNEVFNSGNDAQKKSFDEIFMKRYFSSYIVKESNVYNNRDINSYATGLDAALESDRIKNEILVFENDLWEY